LRRDQVEEGEEDEEEKKTVGSPLAGLKSPRGWCIKRR